MTLTRLDLFLAIMLGTLVSIASAADVLVLCENQAPQRCATNTCAHPRTIISLSYDGRTFPPIFVVNGTETNRVVCFRYGPGEPNVYSAAIVYDSIFRAGFER